MKLSNCNLIIIVVVVLFAFYLIYSQNNQPKYIAPSHPQMSHFNPQLRGTDDFMGTHNMYAAHGDNPYPGHLQHKDTKHIIHEQKPTVTNVNIDYDTDPYSDPIKKQDHYSMMDPLTYPQLRLPREILEKYQKYHEENGCYPPFSQFTKPLFDNPVHNGYLIKQVDENEPFNDNFIPGYVPLFKLKSVKNTNRFFYYIMDPRYATNVPSKMTLDEVKINNKRWNGESYGLPELYDGDIIENIPIYPGAKFKVTLFKTAHHP